ncbi:rab-GTPase-TBC domain-containing protein [Dipodascopsis tothii]|uniref:rab-GTPase-TBC domain-containing protein n=1 Tax=Dipodascopsis tothii TaxID=44089 RepID=UPI0034CF801D
MQPPALLERWNDHYRSEESFLTDRFGFIYDRNHRPIPPPPESRAMLLEIDGQDAADAGAARRDEPQSIGLLSGSPLSSLRLPVIGAVSRATASAADGREPDRFWQTYRSDSVESLVERPARSGSLVSVRALLNQVGDTHESVQRTQKTRWDEFIKKLNADAVEAGLPVIETGELFGVYGRVLTSRQSASKSRWRDFKALVMGGIPIVYRSRIWGECCGAYTLKTPGVYQELVRADGDAESMAQIELDLNRTMPSNVFFGGKGPGVQKLRCVLKAFSVHNPEIGYCQGMNMIAATLLLTHATEEDAFWTFVSLLENILPSGYFDPPLLTSRADQKVLKQLLYEIQPKLCEHLDDLSVDIEAITFNWFLSCFTDCLPPEILFRVWDVFLCVEGQIYLFRVALALFRLNTKALMALTSAGEVYGYMKDLSSQPLTIESVIRISDSLAQQVELKDVMARRAEEIKYLEDEMAF